MPALKRRFAVPAGIVLALVVSVPGADATFPGPNGKIAFNSNRNAGNYDIWTMDPDGTAQVAITGQPATEHSPAWAPHGREIAFVRDEHLYVMDASGGDPRQVGSDYARDAAWSPDGTKLLYSDGFNIVVRDADGDGAGLTIATQLRSSLGNALEPDWSPDGDVVVFSDYYVYPGNRYSSGNVTSSLVAVKPDGNRNATALTGGFEFIDGSPSISPNGETILFSRSPNPAAESGELADLYTIPIGGGAPVQLTNTPAIGEYYAVWSPDGTRIAFSATEAGNTDIFVMNTDGTGRQRVTTDPSADFAPNWRGAVGRALGFPRPKSAVKVNVPLVPSYQECTAPNRTHGPPLAHGSCSPPVGSLAADTGEARATIGTPEVNGYPGQSRGRVRLKAVRGDPSTPADEADVRISVRMTDVRDAADPSAGYPWSLAVPLPLRLTDKRSGCCGAAGTVRDFNQYVNQYADVNLQVEVPCAPAGPGVGSTCSVTTTADSMFPGVVPEGARSVWELAGPLQAYDSGADGSAATWDDNALLATQGIYVP